MIPLGIYRVNFSVEKASATAIDSYYTCETVVGRFLLWLWWQFVSEEIPALFSSRKFLDENSAGISSDTNYHLACYNTWKTHWFYFQLQFIDRTRSKKVEPQLQHARPWNSKAVLWKIPMVEYNTERQKISEEKPEC